MYLREIFIIKLVEFKCKLEVLNEEDRELKMFLIFFVFIISKKMIIFSELGDSGEGKFLRR